MNAEEQKAQSRVGTVLRGKYRIDRVLGIGGMAVVYGVTHRNRKQFALKLLHPLMSHDENLRNRFLREGYVANSVEHPGTVAVLDDDFDEECGAFLVMELLDGETIDELWKRNKRRLPLEVVLMIGHQLIDILGAAHAKGIVHRDVKPANVFLTSAGQIKMLDFGISRLSEGTGSEATQTGTVLGTPAYMAPEQARGTRGEIDGQTDIYSVGATMFALATGKHVHKAESPQHQMILTATEPAPLFATMLPDAPPAIAAVIDRALAFRKTDRWPTAAMMRDAIRDVSVSHFGRPPNDPAIALGMALLPSRSPAAAAPSTWPSAHSQQESLAPAKTAPSQPFTTNTPAPSQSVQVRSASLMMTADAAPPTPGNGSLKGAIVLVVGSAVVLGGALFALFVVEGRGQKATAHAPYLEPAASSPVPAAAAPVAIPDAALAATTASVAGEQVVPVPQPSIAVAPSSPSSSPPHVKAQSTPSTVPKAKPEGAAKPDCNPPYDLDATGKKHWKAECL